jgi:hypothetical protein
LGQRPFSSSLHDAQKVHSKLQIRASVDAAGRSAEHRSQAERISSAISP